MVALACWPGAGVSLLAGGWLISLTSWVTTRRGWVGSAVSVPAIEVSSTGLEGWEAQPAA